MLSVNYNMEEMNGKRVVDTIQRKSKKEYDYDSLLENVCAVIYFRNDALNEKMCYADMSDRKKMDGHGYPWYKGAFGNCLIKLNNSKITDALYLLTNDEKEKIINEYCLFAENNNFSIEEGIAEHRLLLEKYCKKILRREDDINE